MKFQIEQAVEILSQTPATIKNLIENLSDEWVRKTSAFGMNIYLF